MNIEKEQNRLREERNRLQDQVNLIQNQIDKLEIQKHDIDNYLHQYVRIIHNNVIIIMYIEKIKRLVYGPEFIGPMVNQYLTYNSLVFNRVSSFVAMKWEDVHKSVTIITKEEAAKYVKEIIHDINYFK